MNVFDAGNLDNSLVMVFILMREAGRSWDEIAEAHAKARIRVEWTERVEVIKPDGSRIVLGPTSDA